MPLGAPASNLTGPNFTPPFPAYPSGHAGFGGALFETLRRFYGTDDVAFTFNDIVLKPDLGAQNRASYAAVKSVTVVDPTTVRFDLTRKFAALASFLAYNAGILPKHVLSADPLKTTSFNKGIPVSTGPFKVEKYTSGQSVSLVPNENYFGPKPYLDKVVFTVVADPNTSRVASVTGPVVA